MNYSQIEEFIKPIADGIRLLVLDVDGILTDNRLYFSASGEELKAFNTQDGLGIKLLQQAGVKVALITGRQSTIVAERARSLGIEHVIQGRDDKLNVLDDLLAKLGMHYDEVAYAGDDLPDLACISRVKLGITVPNGHFLVREAASVMTSKSGGEGAVREICDWLIIAQGKLEQIIAPYH
jgi:3-deoxy-D-manno-octulosonate 8-phosphate phosphatase (KDO 8-P phosphatase)